MREFEGPKVRTMRERQRYIPAARKAGAIVRQTICMRKGFYNARQPNPIFTLLSFYSSVLYSTSKSEWKRMGNILPQKDCDNS